MNRFVTAFCAFALLLLGNVAQVQAQTNLQVPFIFRFESLEAAEAFFNGNYGDTPEDDSDRPYFNFDMLPGSYGIQPFEGSGALVVDYQIFANNSWGGSMGLVHGLPGETETFYDFSDFTHISLRYNVLQPADPSLTFRLKLHDASNGMGGIGSEGTEDWNSQSGDLFQATPGWKEYIMPLDDLGLPGGTVLPNGFSRPGCSSGGDPTTASGCWSGILGNEKLDLDKISGISFEFFAGSNVHDADSASAGVIAFDNMRVSGVRYDLMNSFDSAGDVVVAGDNGSGNSTLTVVQSDSVQGTGAIELAYNVIGDLDWGGSFDVRPVVGTYPNMTARTAMSLFYKVTEPISGGSADFIIQLKDDNGHWEYTIPNVLNDASGQWQRALIPFDAFAVPSWMSDDDGVINKAAISSVVIQVKVGTGANVSGKILFDRFTTYGELITDTDPPEAVSTFDVMTDAYSNLVSWSDVEGEDGEFYDLYYSLHPITDVQAPGVYTAALKVPEGTNVFLHNIFAPVTDQPVTYYYAIRPSDWVGNIGEITSIGPIQNTGMGIPTISMNPPSNFAADGNISEWSGITPIHLNPDGSLGYIPQTVDNFRIDGGDDLSADVYLAVDEEAIYLAMDVTDDIFSTVPAGVTTDRWLYDGAELYIGLYNEQFERHANLRSSGEERDYKFYLYPTGVRSDSQEDIATAAANLYAFTQTANGYIIEAKIPYANFFTDGAPAFVPQNGMRLPLDIVFMDNDEPGTTAREGILAYSFDNDDNSYQSPRNWSYNWIGDRMVVSVEEIGGELPTQFVLHQNYPNPFTSATTIRYELPRAGNVELTLYNVLGQKVQTLVKAEQGVGTYEVTFDASSLASGVYLYELRTGDVVRVQKMLLVK